MQLQHISAKIYEIRGQKVMLDFDLAALYEAETRTLNQAVRRNLDIFPLDFMFPLTNDEWNTMSSQIAMTYPSKRPKSALPLAFTEQGVAMLSNVLKTKKARQTSVEIVRAFVFMRQYALTHKDLTDKLKELEARYNQHFKTAFDAIDYLMNKDQ